MGSTVWRKAFCKRCGVHMVNELNPLTDEQIAALHEKVRAWRAGKLNMQPVNIRVFNGVDITGLKTLKGDGYNHLKPLYVNP